MTLLGVPDSKDVSFSVGTTTAPAMDMSLDDMIASRRKEQIQAKRTSGRTKVAAADRSLGAGRAKRDAAVAARRGIRQSSGVPAEGGNNAKPKPTAMEVEREVYRQSRQSAQTQARAINRASRGRISADTRNLVPPTTAAVASATGGRRGRRRGPSTAGAAASAMANPPAPSKKAVNAALAAMQQNGYQVPTGMQMLITFAPAGSTTVAAPVTNTPAPSRAAANNNTNNNNNTPRTNTPRRGGRGRGGRAGRGPQA